MMDNTYIFLYRDLLKKPIWKKSTPEQKTILIALLLMANHKEHEWEWMGKKFKVLPGQFVTSLESIVNECGKGISIQNVRSALDRFEKLQFLTNESTKTGRLITICNWVSYQTEKCKRNKANNREVTDNQQTGNNEVTPNNNDNNDEHDNNNKKLNISFDEFWELYDKKQDKPDCASVWEKLSDEERALIMAYIPKYKNSTEKQYRKYPIRFLKKRGWENEIPEGKRENLKLKDNHYASAKTGSDY